MTLQSLGQFTCDLAVIANKRGSVTLDELPFHSGRGEARVGTGQLDSYRQDQSEREKEAAPNHSYILPIPTLMTS